MIRQVPDLVEEQASVVRYLELTGAIRPGVGEGPFTCPEQLALEQRLRDSAHIHRYHGLILAGG